MCKSSMWRVALPSKGSPKAFRGKWRMGACIPKSKRLEDDQLRRAPSETTPVLGTLWTHAQRMTTIAGRVHP
jgi:hypothetical protein